MSEEGSYLSTAQYCGHEVINIFEEQIQAFALTLWEADLVVLCYQK